MEGALVFEDGSKYAYGLKSSRYVEMLQCAFYPLNIGYHGKASRVRMVGFEGSEK